MEFDSLPPGVLPGCMCPSCRSWSVHFGGQPGAQARSLALMKSCLSDSQRGEFEASGTFTVRGSSGGRYSISPRYSYNVRDLRTQEQICAGPYEDPVPLFDQMLAQKLCLETDETRFRRIALR